ncbi:MAG: vitamin B12-dependent ribonucleotide reductase [candidate division Zixibacteria bacterium]|nr:vitamin B12-dependent ribonucleotide reductase [candidate division Zixibacteria bacterium]
MEEVKKTLPELSENALKVLERRYLAKDGKGNVIETPEGLFRRVARIISAPDQTFGATPEEVKESEEAFYKMMAQLQFMPNSPTLMNAGRPLGQLSACFVLPIDDSMESIFTTVKNTALIHKSGGGTGFAFSRLRPQNAVVASTSGVASGPISFMKVINAATEAVKQGGTRRGANMGVLRVDHPDIIKFINCKDDLSELTNFNISVAITDAFMEAVENDAEYDMLDPRTDTAFVVDGKPLRLKAREVFEQILEHAHTTGEPGVMFLDRMNDGNPVSQVGLYESTNPCGEQPLLPYESCNLGSINLSRMIKAVVDSGTESMYRYEVDWDLLDETVEKSVHFLDNVIEANRYPLPEIDANTKSNRKIGLGVMGWADMLIMMGLRYDSDEAYELADKVMGRINEVGHNKSREMCKKRGHFPLWERSRFYGEGTGPEMRNSTITTIAPTGTISIITGCSSGIEPLFAVSYVRTVMDNDKLIEVNPTFEKMAKERGFYSQELMERIAEVGSVQHFEEVPEDIRALFVTSHDVLPKNHVRMQAVWQKNVDNAVSKTINLPNSATLDDVRDAYLTAYQTGCKGVTVYRDGCRANQVLSTGKTAKKDDAAAGDGKVSPKKKNRPEDLHGITSKIKTGYGNLYVTVNTIDGKPFEVFAQIGKSGYSTMADTEAICRLISLGLRSGIPVKNIVNQLKGIGGASPVFGKGGLISSIPDAIAIILHKHFGNGNTIEHNETDLDNEFCPDCNMRIEHESGCLVCRSCGYSKC